MPGHRHAGRLGRAADQEPRPAQGGRSTPSCPKRNQKEITTPHRGVPVPQVRPRHDVGALPRTRCEAAGREGRDETSARLDRHRHGRRAARRDRRHRDTQDGVSRHRVPCDHVISSMPISRAGARPWTRRRPTEVVAAADDLHYRDFLTVALVVPETRELPRQLDLHPRHRRRGRPHPELRLVVALPGQGRPHLPRARVLRLRGRRHVEHARRRADRAGHPRARASSAWSTAADVEARLRRPDAQGLSVSTTSPTRPTSRPSASGSSRARPNVHPVGRNGMHKYNNQDHSMYTAMLTVGEHPTAPTTTSGRSTSRRSTTRRARTPPAAPATAPAATRRSCPATC